jgi:hypothetical protein
VGAGNTSVASKMAEVNGIYASYSDDTFLMVLRAPAPAPEKMQIPVHSVGVCLETDEVNYIPIECCMGLGQRSTTKG